LIGYLFYDFLSTLVLLLGWPYLLYQRLVHPGEWRERLGKAPCDADYWIHGASLGEVTGIAPFAREIKKLVPEAKIAVSTVTVGGRERALKLVKEAQACFIAPLDLWFCSARAVRRLRPRALFLMETELWPNLIRFAKRGGAKVIVLNGRMSEKGYKRFKRWRLFARVMLSRVDFFLVQTERDKGYFAALGVSPDQLETTGSLKLGMLPKFAPGLREALRKEFGWEDSVPVAIAGSTRPGEEEVVLQAWGKVVAELPKARLVIAPRHKERFCEVESLIRKAGYQSKRRSERPLPDRSPEGREIWLLDTMGELASVYAVADCAFVGGSLVQLGGHNPMEPAAHGVPVLFGPSVENAEQVADLLLTSGGGQMVENAEQLAQAMLDLLSDTTKYQERGRAARDVAREATGGMEKTIQYLQVKGLL
jgi:3-deoxy-D-manno-octulosonic-acid transferase